MGRKQPMRLSTTPLEPILPRVIKPARYTGGEWNSVVRDWETTPIKVALAYPDVYEVGMSNLALMILYDLFNQQEDVLAERVYTPWVDNSTCWAGWWRQPSLCRPAWSCLLRERTGRTQPSVLTTSVNST